MEEWTKVIYLDKIFNDYEVSTMGRIRSLKYGKCKILSPSKSFISGGYYLKVSLYGQGKALGAYVHRIVMNSFVGKRPKGKVVSHVNFNSLDNRLSNLDYISHRKNNSLERTIKSGLPVGVTKNGISYMSKIKIKSNNNRAVYLGRYDTPEKASMAYNLILDSLVVDEFKSKDSIRLDINKFRESIGMKPINKYTAQPTSCDKYSTDKLKDDKETI